MAFDGSDDYWEDDAASPPDSHYWDVPVYVEPVDEDPYWRYPTWEDPPEYPTTPYACITDEVELVPTDLDNWWVGEQPDQLDLEFFWVDDYSTTNISRVSFAVYEWTGTTPSTSNLLGEFIVFYKPVGVPTWPNGVFTRDEWHEIQIPLDWDGIDENSGFWLQVRLEGISYYTYDLYWRIGPGYQEFWTAFNETAEYQLTKAEEAAL